MGGSSPSAPVTVMPTPTAPTLYASVVPQQSYRQTGEFLNRTKKQTNEAQDTLFAQAGTPAELGVRQAGTNQQAAANYLAAVPTGDKYTRALSGVSDQYQPVREAAQQNLSQAQLAYANAVSKVKEKPKPLDTDTLPSWATETIPEGMPGYVVPKTA